MALQGLSAALKVQPGRLEQVERPRPRHRDWRNMDIDDPSSNLDRERDACVHEEVYQLQYIS